MAKVESVNENFRKKAVLYRKRIGTLAEELPSEKVGDYVWTSQIELSDSVFDTWQ